MGTTIDRREYDRLKAARYRAANAEKVRAYTEANKERRRERAAQWAKDNPERALQNHANWRRKNPEAVKARWRNRRAALKASPGAHTAEEVAALLEKQGHQCAACRASLTRGYELDHVLPLCLGGHNRITNIQLLCRTCNRKKGGKHPDDWAREVASWAR